MMSLMFTASLSIADLLLEKSISIRMNDEQTPETSFLEGVLCSTQ